MWIVFRAAGVGRTIAWLFQACFRIKLHVGIRIGYVISFLRLRKSPAERPREVPGLLHVSSVDKSYRTVISEEMGSVTLLLSESKTGLS